MTQSLPISYNGHKVCSMGQEVRKASVPFEFNLSSTKNDIINPTSSSTDSS